MPGREEPRRRAVLFDEVDGLAFLFLGVGIVLLVWGAVLDPPGDANRFVLRQGTDWAPGLVTDGLLLLVLNRILRRHERKRVIAQVASLSNEFALDAVRRVRQEGWHVDGSLEGGDLDRARLAEADLSGARLAGASLSASDLRAAALHHADLRGADLTAANLRGADLRWCDLRGARLRWCDLRDALLDGAMTEGADFGGAALDPRTRTLLGRDEGEVGLLSELETALVRSSMKELEAMGTAPIEDFYRRLFEAHPHLRSLFRADPDQQARKFLHTLSMIVAALDAPERHMPVLRSLGARHAGYGVRREHYRLVSRILLEVFEAHLGERFTPEIRAAWERGLGIIAAAMIEAASASPAETGATPRRSRG